MTWPFENDTSAITKKLANRSIKTDKRSKAFLLLTIALSVCMIFSIILIAIGAQEEFKNTQRNKAQIAILGITDAQLSSLRQNKDVQWIGEYATIRFFYLGNKTITVAYGSEDYFIRQEEQSLQGSVPQKANEIMLPQNYIDFLGKTYHPGDTIVFDVTGTGHEEEYTLSGILNEKHRSDGYFVYLNKELAMSLMEHLQVTAYTRLNTDAIHSADILDFTDKVIENTGILEDQVNLTEYFSVMTGAIQPGIQLPVPLLAALTATLAATIVYGVFYTKITKNVQMFGQLRTIGMTRKQIRRMARNEGLQYAFIGIPLGLLTGVLIGFLAYPKGFQIKTAAIYAVLIAIVGVVMVNIAIFKPVRVAMNTSPIEGTRYLAYSGKQKGTSKLQRKLSPQNLAKINIQRNRKKAILTLVMLGVSGALLLGATTVAGSIDPEKQAIFKYYPAGSILLQVKNHIGSSFDIESEPYGSSMLQLEENPLENQTLLRDLGNIAGIENVTAFNCVCMSITFPGGGGSITSIMDMVPTLNRDQIAEKQLVLSSGTADYDDMTERNGILVAENIAKVGEILQLEGRSYDGSIFNINAVVAGTYNITDLMERSPVVPGSPYFIMTYDMAKKLTGISNQTGILAIKTVPEYFDEVLSAVQEIAAQNGTIEVNTIKQTVKNIQYRYSSSIKALYMVAGILFVFGSISLMNMLMVDFQNRKREFCLLKAIGATQKQLKLMLNREIGIYCGSSLLVALAFGGLISIVACRRLDAVSHCISLKLPWLFLVALVVIMAGIYLIFAVYAKAELKKAEILPAIREE